MEMFVDEGMWVRTPRQKADYIRMYEYLIPKAIRRQDPDTFYWPASPSSGGAFDKPNDPARGDVHNWDVWHGFAPFSEYRKHSFRYLSEFGFESFPCLKTVETYTLPEDRNLFSYVMEKHQRCERGNALTMAYLQQMFRYPTSFETALYASQRGDPLWGGAFPAHQGDLYGGHLLAAERLLAGSFLGFHRLYRALEGASLLCQALFRAGVALLL